MIFHKTIFLWVSVVVSNFCVSSAPRAEETSGTPLGILVQFKDQAVLNSVKFHKLIKKAGLVPHRFHPSLRVQTFRWSPGNVRGAELAPIICIALARQFADVSKCEVDLPLGPEKTLSLEISNSCGGQNSNILDPTLTQFFLALKNASNQSCDLFLVQTADYDYRKITKGSQRTPFWAQEYVGSDLLTEEMSIQKVDTKKAAALIAVWDTQNGEHGEFVSNLIAGPYESSPIRLKKTLKYVATDSSSDFVFFSENLIRLCNEKSNCLRFINNSMGWNGGSLAQQAVGGLASKGVVFVTAAGNEAERVDPGKRESARDGSAIIVASHAPDGLSSDFTSFAPEVDITAPSDHSILSVNHRGVPSEFGGTSGAAPVVTSALLAFELISGLQLSTPQFKELLRKTAIRHLNDPPRKVTGAGYLNTYKIGAIGFKLKKHCGDLNTKKKRDECMLNALLKADFYDFSKEVNTEEIISDFEGAFPECGNRSPKVIHRNQGGTCDHKKMALKALRKAAFLMPQRLELWEKLACVSGANGWTVNEVYYTRLAKGTRLDDPAIMGNADVIEAMTSQESLREDRKFVLGAIRKGHAAALEYASEGIKNDRALVLAAVRKNPSALQHASQELRGDREIVRASVEKDGLTLQYASQALQSDRELVFLAVRQNKMAYQYTSVALQDDPELKAVLGLSWLK